MSTDPNELLHGYLDDILSEAQHQEFMERIKRDGEFTKRFVELALLHDHMRTAIIGIDDDAESVPTTISIDANKPRRLPIRMWWFAASVAILCVGILWTWIGQTNAIAAVRELDRIIQKNTGHSDRVFEIVVEHVFAPSKKNDSQSQEDRRPPKPPLDGALLYVRDPNQFVLVRRTEDGSSFVTGCNGKSSWAVRPDGPVRVSDDQMRFNRDLPGHETSIPLTNIHEGLEHLKKAYRIQISNLGPEEYEPESGNEYRMLIAIKKPKERGPQRVEVVYDAVSGNVRHFRFVQMPYGPVRLDLRLELVSDSQLEPTFFDHESHHSSNRTVVEE